MVAEEIGAKIQVIPINDAGEIILEEYEKLLHPKVKLISLTYVSNTLGSINPVKDFIKLAHLNQSLVFIDAAQAVAHLKIDVTDLDADFLAFSGHKMFGPTGAGVLYGKKDLLQSMPPYQGGGNMIDVVSFEKTTFNELPHKFEAGTPPIASIIALSNAIEYIHSVGFSTIHHIESDLLAYATSALKEIPGLKIYGEAKNKASVISFGIEGIHAHDLGTLLDKDAVAIRSGHHCTQPLMKFFKVAAMARASFSLYNDQADVDQLVSTLIKIKKLFT
jgi:cysteine desulfurase/selenocysteine lyase